MIDFVAVVQEVLVEGQRGGKASLQLVADTFIHRQEIECIAKNFSLQEWVRTAVLKTQRGRVAISKDAMAESPEV
ncbi:MAG: hypothetical protein U5L09_10540 [Bacteroidales bacterium]|nr:hypothetical protein [Bacteroidales bacterium]